MTACRLDSYGSGEEPVVDTCEHGTASLDSNKEIGISPNYLSDC